MDKLAGWMLVAVLITGHGLPLHAEGGRHPERVTLGVDWDAVKRDWPRMGPLDRAVWERIFAAQMSRSKAAEPFADPDGARPDFPSELCFTATLPPAAKGLPLVTLNTTVDRFDVLDLSVSGACAGGGTQFSGTGLGPDLVYKLHVDVPCDLEILVDPRMRRGDSPNEWDVALYVIREAIPPEGEEERPVPCQDPAESCVRSSDGGGIGQQEAITFSASTAEDYYVVVDGYVGSAGPFEITIREIGSTGCRLSRIMLDEFFAD